MKGKIILFARFAGFMIWNESLPTEALDRVQVGGIFRFVDAQSKSTLKNLEVFFCRIKKRAEVRFCANI